MSARGWAGVVERYAKLADNAGDGRGLRSFEQTSREWHDDAAALRELAALLDRIEPRMTRALRIPADDRTDIGVKLAADAIEILTALHRGPAEQQEGGL